MHMRYSALLLAASTLAAALPSEASAHGILFWRRAALLSPQANEQLIMQRRLFFWRVANVALTTGQTYIPQGPNRGATGGANLRGGEPEGGTQLSPAVKAAVDTAVAAAMANPTPPADLATLTPTDFCRLDALLMVPAVGGPKPLTQVVADMDRKLDTITTRLDQIDKKSEEAQQGLSALAAILLKNNVIKPADLKQ